MFKISFMYLKGFLFLFYNDSSQTFGSLRGKKIIEVTVFFLMIFLFKSHKT